MITAGGILAEVTVLAVDPTDAPRFQADTEVKALQGHHLSSAISSISDSKRSQGGHPSKPRAAGMDQSLSIDAENREDGKYPEIPQRGLDMKNPAVGLKSDKNGSKMTALLEKYSGKSPLVIVTLPKRRQAQTPHAWLQSAEDLVAPLKRVIFVQESGSERIQFYRD